MSAVKRRLQLHFPRLPQAVDPDNGCVWIFYQQLEKLPPDFFVPTLHQQTCLKIEFDILLNQLAETIQTQHDLKKHENELITALMLAEILQYQYYHFLAVKRDAAYFRKRANILRLLLIQLNYVFVDKNNEHAAKLAEWQISQTIRTQTDQYNLLRQIIQRSRKFILEGNCSPPKKSKKILDTIFGRKNLISKARYFSCTYGAS